MNEKQQAVAYRLIGIMEDAHRDCDTDRLMEADEAERLAPRRCQVCDLLEEFNKEGESLKRFCAVCDKDVNPERAACDAGACSCQCHEHEGGKP